ncbi:MAG: peptidoglycan DD-metalloendopeptidase family protein [Bacteroidales bacterium]|nr:peptidoglycan DD-metalloendopeptidase family protein [Bacteroidales bacterium]
MRLLRFLLLMLLCVGPMADVPVNVSAQQKTAQTRRTQQTNRKTQSKTSAKKKTTSSKASTKKTTTSKSTTPQRKLSRAEYEQQQNELIRQIAATERMITDNDKSVLSQSRDIKLRQDEIRKRQALLQSMQDEIESIRQEEDSLSRRIAQLRSEYRGKQDKYAAAVQHIFKWRSGYDEWLFVLSAQDLAQSMRRVRYLRQYSKWRQQEAHQLARQRMATESVQEKLVLTRQERERVMQSLQKEKNILAKKQARQETALRKLKSKQRELKAALARDQKKQRQIQRLITKMIEEERRKSADAGKSGGKSGKSKPAFDYSSPESVQLTGSFRQNKGRMPFPVDTDFSILSHYTKDGNYSITLSTGVGAHACAIFEGTVQRVAKSSEDWTVIIRHGEYMSVYSNLSACHVSEGQKVKMRQSIGRVKEDIDGHCAELMFWIFGRNEAENPEAWLSH